MPKSDKEEGDSNREVGSADFVEEPAEDKKKKEAKASTSNTDKEKKKPAAEKRGKEKVSEEVKGPTKDELHAAISKLLEEANLVQISPDDIPQQLGALFEVDLTDRKEEVLQIIDDVINSKLFKSHGIPLDQKMIISVKKLC